MQDTKANGSSKKLPYERKDTKNQSDWVVQWMFDAEIVDGPCDGCGHETTRRKRVRNVFGDPLCVSCWGDRKRNAPKAMTDGGPELGDGNCSGGGDRCDYCDGYELAYQMETGRGLVVRCLPCLAVERAQTCVRSPADRHTEKEHQQVRGWLSILARIRQDEAILKSEDDIVAVHDSIREFLTNILGEDAYKRPSDLRGDSGE